GSFEAAALGLGEGVSVTWSTIAETDNAGFNVYRAASDGSVGEKLNSALIPSESVFGGGAEYSFLDAVVLTKSGEERAYYLEDVDLSGKTTLHGPATATLGQGAASVSNWAIFE
ncbi:MAG: hypothetical protein RLY93_13740, partial [Sumerlaeia bacterium]